jgi:CPA2 family monovalent cation:H+ antiporter-2
MESWPLIADVVLLITTALLLGIAAERLKQNALIGYLLTGILFGPSGLQVVNDIERVRGLAELGVALLLFTIGLEFSFTRLRELGAVAIGGGTLQILLTGGAVIFIASSLGRPLPESLVLAGAISMSSTAIVLRVLQDRAELDSLHGRNALGILLLQDLAVVPLVLMISLLGEGVSGWRAVEQLGLRAGVAVLLIAVLYFVANHVSPRLVQQAASLGNRDLPVVFAVAFCLGSTWASHAAGLSPVLGAFVAGMLLAELPFAQQIRADVSALRAIFVTFFVAAIGLLAQLPSEESLLTLAAVVAGIIFLKAFLVGGVVRIFRQPPAVAAATGMALAQIGEFSFVLLELGFRANIVAEGMFQLMLSASVATLFLTPYLTAAGSRLFRMMSQAGAVGLPERAARGERGTGRSAAGRVLVIGYGPAGQQVVEKLREAGMPFLVLELNARTVAANRSAICIESGDATQTTILDHHAVGEAQLVVVTLPDPQTAELVIRQTKLVAPQVRVVARSRYHVHAAKLQEAGADHVVDEEELVGSTLGAEVLSRCFGKPLETRNA